MSDYKPINSQFTARLRSKLRGARTRSNSDYEDSHANDYDNVRSVLRSSREIRCVPSVCCREKVTHNFTEHLHL